MKMQPQEFNALKTAINNRFSAADRVAIWSRYVARGLSADRFRWDMLAHSEFNVAKLYVLGLNDAHIDTALRAILPINPET